jgi:hypothetical protein
MKLYHRPVHNFNVTGFVKPGSDILTLTDSAKGAIEELTKNYVLVFVGGGGGATNFWGKKILVLKN